MRFEIFTLFPGYFSGPFGSSILKRAIAEERLEIGLHDVRDWSEDKHRKVDDYPFGGGAGMVIKAEPVARALEDVLNFAVGVSQPPCPVVWLTPQGRTFNQSVAEELAKHPRIALLCGHYEGLDERLVETGVTDEISLGDFILTGGEPAAAVIVDAVARLLPDVLGNEHSAQVESFSNGLLESPHYTRPATWRGRAVPDVLLSGNHAHIEIWRFREGLRRTLLRRPELLERAPLGREWTRSERKVLQEVLEEFEAARLAEGEPEVSQQEKHDES